MKIGRIQAIRSLLRRDAGFTLAEILAAVGVISFGLIGVAAGLMYAYGGIEYGRQQTTAAFLAEQRMEQVKNTALTNFAAVTIATFPAEAYGSIANAPTYRRTVTITNNPGGVVDTKLIQVTVFYRAVTGWSVSATENQVQLATLMAERK